MTAVRFERNGAPPLEATLGRVVAEGGAGVVQEARSEDGKTVIVKRSRAGGEALLEYERVTCEQVDHPSLVRYLGTANPDGLGPLVAFEALGANPLLALNGPQLRPEWRDPDTFYYPLPPNRAIEIAFDLLLALEHLHERGLVHADVKLSNLLARVPGDRGAGATLRSVAEGRFTGVLIDLGSVRRTAVLEAINRGDADLSLIPSITPHYAPPEALFESARTGGRKLFSPSMDMYSFTLVFYVLLTGRIPYGHLASADKLKDIDAIFDLKTNEARGALCPVDTRFVSRIPLHDVGFEGTAVTVWPTFHATVTELLRRGTDPDPAKRLTVKAARTLFQEAFRMRFLGEAGPRAWVQGIFQMRPRSNRLLRDAPLGGIRIREDGKELIVEEAPPPADALPVSREKVAADDGSTISYKPEARRASQRLSKAPPAPKGMVYLADVLREFKAKRPLPVAAPVLVTRTGFAPAELVKCTLFSLEQARSHVKISDSAQDAVSQKSRVSVGRGDDNDIVLQDNGVSKRHLSFEKGPDGGWWVIDNASSNGTFVDDDPVERNGKMRISRGLATIGLGLTAKLTFMDAHELESYLARALDVWTQAFAGKASGRHPKLDDGATITQTDGPGDQTEVSETPRQAPIPRPIAPTRRQRIGELTEAANPTPRSTPAPRSTPVPRSTPTPIPSSTPAPRPAGATPATGSLRPLAATLEELAQKLAELTDVARFAVHFEGARADDYDSVSEVLDLLAAKEPVLGVDVVFNSGKKVVLYRKNAGKA